MLNRLKPKRNLSNMKDIPWDLHHGVESDGQTFIRCEKNVQLKLKF